MRRSSAVVLLVITAMACAPAPALAGGNAAGRIVSARSSVAVGADGFLSPDRKIWCSGNAKEIGCVSLPGTADQANHGAILRSDGRVVLCPEGSAGPGWKCFQNFDEKAPVLRYGRSAEIGGFTYASTRQGITCTVRASGRGFRINGDEVVAVR
jgi:hypothetical protein